MKGEEYVYDYTDRGNADEDHPITYKSIWITDHYVQEILKNDSIWY